MFPTHRSDRRPGARPATPATRVARKLQPHAEGLEARVVLSITGLTVSASPMELRPTNPRNQPHSITTQHVIPVTISGLGTFTSGPVKVSYQVFDEQGRYQPSGTFVPRLQLQPAGPAPAGSLNFFYAKRIGLSIVRPPVGRVYTIVVTAEDGTGASQVATNVIVPPVGFFHRNPSIRYRS